MRYLGSKTSPLDLATKEDTANLTVDRYGLVANTGNVRMDTNINRNAMAVYGKMVTIKLDFTWTKDGNWGQIATINGQSPTIPVVTEVQVDGGGNIYISPDSRSIVAGGGMVKGKRYIVTMTNFL